MIPGEESELRRKQESSNSSDYKSSWTWSRFKPQDPRIVRVSKALGGKDRHSKVCTVRGLRDRRVRLSVPTAIQLYDLQERLGLNQPSKVVDWLLNAAKHEIDELPPLQIPQDQLLPSQSHKQLNMGNPNLTLSHPPISLGITGEHEEYLHNYSLVQFPPSHHLLLHQPAGLINTHPYFPTQTHTSFHLKQPNFHTSDSSTQLQFTFPSQNKQPHRLHSS